VTNDEAVKACRESGIKVSVLCTSAQGGEECQLHPSAVSHQEKSLLPWVILDVLKNSRIIYKQVTKLRLFILQIKCCWYLLYTGCTSHIAQRLQNEKFVRCRQNRQQRPVFWMEISYTRNCRVNGPPSLLQRHTYNCAAATRRTMVVSSLINFILRCGTWKCKTRYLLRLTYPIHIFSLRNFA
jgi:hypothetical protein